MWKQVRLYGQDGNEATVQQTGPKIRLADGDCYIWQDLTTVVLEATIIGLLPMPTSIPTSLCLDGISTPYLLCREHLDLPQLNKEPDTQWWRECFTTFHFLLLECQMLALDSGQLAQMNFSVEGVCGSTSYYECTELLGDQFRRCRFQFSRVTFRIEGFGNRIYRN